MQIWTKPCHFKDWQILIYTPKKPRDDHSNTGKNTYEEIMKFFSQKEMEIYINNFQKKNSNQNGWETAQDVNICH